MLSYAYLPILTHLVCHHMLTYQSFLLLHDVPGTCSSAPFRRARCVHGCTRCAHGAFRSAMLHLPALRQPVCSACDAPLPVLVAGSARATAAAGIESRCHGCKVRVGCRVMRMAPPRRAAMRMSAARHGLHHFPPPPPCSFPLGTRVPPRPTGARVALRRLPPPSARDLRLVRRMLARWAHGVPAGVVRQAQLLPRRLRAPSAIVTLACSPTQELGVVVFY